MNKLSVIIATSECDPLAKTGGLADVVSVLSKELKKLDIDVYIFLPFYRDLQAFESLEIKDLKLNSVIRIGNIFQEARYFQTKLPYSDVLVYLVRNDSYFFRNQLYSENGGDYKDNFDRFLFFNKAILNFILLNEMKIDIIHCNDWQTAFLPFLLKLGYPNEVLLKDIKILFTIHNFGYQGIFNINEYHKFNLNWEYCTTDKIEYYGKINLLKSALVFSDAINTVSPTYRKELLENSELSKGLTYYLNLRKNEFYGILNGVDYNNWNPETDRYIKWNYSADDLSKKNYCKKDLLKFAGFRNYNRPLLVMVSRLVGVKGLDILIDGLNKILKKEVNLIILGKGDPIIERQLSEFESRFNNFRLFLDFNEEFAHRIYAGGDILLMPSHFEPCGLNQLYAMRYGTIPVVHFTGGLADTVVNYMKDKKNGTGFVFYNYNFKDLIDTINEAVKLYKNETGWKLLQRRCMKQNFSWKNSAREYVKLYNKIAL